MKLKTLLLKGLLSLSVVTITGPAMAQIDWQTIVGERVIENEWCHINGRLKIVIDLSENRFGYYIKSGGCFEAIYSLSGKAVRQKHTPEGVENYVLLATEDNTYGAPRILDIAHSFGGISIDRINQKAVLTTIGPLYFGYEHLLFLEESQLFLRKDELDLSITNSED